MNESISTLAALPTAAQPCGANGVQFSARVSGSAVSDGHEQQRREHAGHPELQPRGRLAARSALAAMTPAIIAAAAAIAPSRPTFSSSAT